MSIIYYVIYFFILVIVYAKTDSCEECDDFECGRRYVLGKEVIANGSSASARNWPWFAKVLIRDKHNKDKIKHRFDGSIISPTAVLTCAHMAYKNEKQRAVRRFLVQAGTSKYVELGKFYEIGRQILPVERILVHPGYRPGEASFDLAILLVNKLVFTEYVQPICVWGPLYDKTELFGQQAVIASFKSYDREHMQVSNAVVPSDDICVSYAPKFEDDLNEFNFCYGDIFSGSNQKMWSGGSGLALAVTHDDNVGVTWYLHGVSSRCILKSGGGECDPQKLSLFAYVAPHYAWIHHHAFSN